jgi:hypothetical protein
MLKRGGGGLGVSLPTLNLMVEPSIRNREIEIPVRPKKFPVCREKFPVPRKTGNCCGF